MPEAIPHIPSRAILHVDMDAFFASVEQLDDPALRGRPVLVGHDGPRGVVAAASYESRVFGCRSAQPVAVAKRLCPHAVVVPGRFWRYREVSAQVFELMHAVTPLVQPLSIDEAFLDVTGSVRLLGDPVHIARTLKDRIKATTGLTGSIGVAPNKFLAKLASDMDKPDGLTVITAADAERVLAPLPVGRIFGVGPQTEKRLAGIGVRTIGDLVTIDPAVLARRVGDDETDRYRRLARGLDDRPVVPDRDAKSIGQEQTFGRDLTDPDAVRAVLLRQAEEVGRRLRKHAFRARGVVVKIRFGDFQTVTRRTTLPQATDATNDVWHAARDLFDRWAAGGGFRPVRLIGMAATDFATSAAADQLDLFANRDHDKQRRLDATLDKIRAKFGDNGVRRSGV
ncbi:MAG: dinB [Phycisphaerales bacterium]|nr:dinB [Phycisphaerales bacterium]